MKGSVFKREAEAEEDEERATTLGTKIFGKHLHKVHITTTTTTEENFIDGKTIFSSCYNVLETRYTFVCGRKIVLDNGKLE